MQKTLKQSIPKQRAFIPSTLQSTILSIMMRNSKILLITLLTLTTLCFWASASYAMPNPTLESAMNRQFGPEDSIDIGPPNNDGQQDGLTILLNEGTEQPDAPVDEQSTVGEPLTDEEIQAVLQRLPALETDDVVDVLPPPRPGETIDERFPADETEAVPDSPDGDVLAVIRFAPEGEIPLAPFLNVTFNQPMVPLATLEELSALDVPVTIEPALPGTWRWIGTKTLTFEFDDETIDRFPMATEYVATIPAGTESATGNVLAEAVTWTFQTPAPQIQRFYPEFEPQPQDPIIFIAFDQQIDPEAVLETISVTASREQFELSLVTQEEAEADEQIKRRLEQTRDGYWLAFRADEPFPTATTVAVNVGPNTPSVEGPLTTESVQSFSFQTFAPLRIERHFCGFSTEQCPPMLPLEILFNNSLDVEKFDESMISVEPEIPNMRVELFGSVLFLEGTTQGRTTYEVTITTAAKDVFGQSLEEDQTVEFTTTEMPRFFTGPESHFVTLDPSVTVPTFNIFSVNYDRLRVRAYAVQPEEWPLYLEFYRRSGGRVEESLEPPGTQVLSDEFTINAEQDELVETAIPLRDALGSDTGHLIVIVDSTEKSADSSRGFNRSVMAWVQVTQIGLDAFVDHSEMLVWANALTDGTPLEGVEVSLLANRGSATTDSKGITRLELSTSNSSLLIGRLDNDVAFLPQSDFPWSDGGWQKRPTRDQLRWYVFDDRQMYRPGEEVHAKGWLRSIGMIQESDIELAPDFTSISYEVRGPRGNEITTGVADINALGGFDINFDLPSNSNLGSASIVFRARGSDSEVNNLEHFHFFQVQEFRRPEFEVSARVETVGPFFIKPTSEDAGQESTSAIVAVEGTYFTGGVLPNADVDWQISARPGDYSPPGWDDFVFGQWTPWWFFNFEEPSGQTFQSFNSSTDATGTHYLNMSFEGATEHRPYSVQAQGLDGNVIEDTTLEITAERLVWKRIDGEFKEEAEETQSCIVISTEEPVLCTFTTEVGGRYRITATVQDEEGRKNQSQFIRWVSGSQSPPSREIIREEALIIPDKESYQPGDVAEILIQTPFLPAEGLLTLRRNGILYTERFTMNEGTCILNIPIEEGHTPNLHIQVDLTGASARTDDAGDPLEGVPDR